MPGHDIIVIGGSAGGVEALRELTRGLPPDLPAAVFAVLHVTPAAPSALPEILSRNSALPARHAVDGEAIEYGRVYVAPPDHHLLVESERVRVVRGPKENRVRPAADPLFRSAAKFYGPRVVGVVLTGALDDGTAGLAAIKRRGGVAVVQDPEEALYSGMPRSALENVAVDHCLPLAGIAPLLGRLAMAPAQEAAAYPVSEFLEVETRIARNEEADMEDVGKLGTPSAFTCPECKGALWELNDGELLRFRCHVGHAFSIESLAADQTEQLESALWAALQSLEQNAALLRRMAARARERNHQISLMRYEDNVQRVERHAAVIREVLRNNEKAQVSE
jgi:two-component system chemotaxis response regulator CheB